MPDFRTASSTCESYYSADAADQVVVGWSCSDNAKGLVYVWGGGDDGTVSCNSEKHFLCVTTPGFPDLPVDEKCPSAAMASHPVFNTVLGDMGHVTCTKVPTFKKDPCQDPAEIIIILNNIYIKLIYWRFLGAFIVRRAPWRLPFHWSWSWLATQWGKRLVNVFICFHMFSAFWVRGGRWMRKTEMCHMGDVSIGFEPMWPENQHQNSGKCPPTRAPLHVDRQHN